MSNLVVFTHLTLDGVMQAPGRADEDPRGAFKHGGRALPQHDSVRGTVIAGSMAQTGPLLFGGRTFEDFFKVWPERKDNPFTEVLDNAQKYVALTTLTEPLPWKNSTLLKGHTADAVARSRHSRMIRDDHVDEYLLMIHPLVLGSGRRHFPNDGTSVRLRLVEAKTTTTGVVIATYRPVERTGAKVQEDAR